MDDLPPEIAALIEQKRRADEPSAEDQARVGKSLATALGLPNTGWIGAESADAAATSGATATATSAVASTSTGIKVALVVAAVVTGASAVFVWRADVPAPDSQSSRAASAAWAAPKAQSEPGRSASARRASAPASGSNAVSAQPLKPETLAPPPAALAPLVHPESRPSRAPTHVRKQKSAPPPTASQTESPPLAAELDIREPGDSERSASSTARKEALLEEELALIEAASHALDTGETAAAMKALETHRSRFDAGFLSEERDALWIVALCSRGSTAEAAAARATFERRAPRSPLRVRIEKQCQNLGKQ
jgi:hypothetical protein